MYRHMKQGGRLCVLAEIEVPQAAKTSKHTITTPHSKTLKNYGQTY